MGKFFDVIGMKWRIHARVLAGRDLPVRDLPVYK